MTNKLIKKITALFGIGGVSGSLQHTTKIIRQEDYFMDYIDVTECCKIGPITNENYCPKCGKQIIKQ